MLRFSPLIGLLVVAIVPAAKLPSIAFKQQADRLHVTLDGHEIAEYVWSDLKILRPYFRHLRTSNGVQVTRNSPPIAGKDADDHATMHPGLWLAFGDLGGSDFWRNRGQVKHAGFIVEPKGGLGRGTFTVRNSYEVGSKIICTEECEIVVTVQPLGYRIDWTSTFRAKDAPFTFGDQEEMGLGVRVATPLTVTKGGQITDSVGRKNGAQVWGKSSDWCDYGGILDDRRVGVLLMPDPKNFRPCWFHARDYGLLVANPFGRKAFTKGEASRVTVQASEEFRLRFGIEVYALPKDQKADWAEMYRNFLKR